MGRRATGLSLEEVVKVGYGEGELLQRTSVSRNPWCCFALWTSKRAFVFWTPEELVAESFVVGLSHLCPRAEGRRVGEVRWHRALCKLGKDRDARAATL